MHRQTHLTSASAATVITLAIALSLQAPGAAQQPQPAPATPAQPPAGRGGPPGASNAPGGFPRVPTLPFPDAPREVETVGVKLRAVPVAKGLVNPWSLAFLPNGDMLVTERPGRLRIVRKGTLDPEPIAGTPQVWATGQGGLLEVLPHPQFAQNNLLYLTYSKPCEKGATTALLRGKFDGKALTDAKDLFVADNCNTGNPHFGSKLAFGRDGMLYMTIGERGDRDAFAEHQHPRRQDPAAQGRRHGSAGQPVRREAGLQAGDLQLRPSQSAGARLPPGHRRALGDRTRPAGWRRAQQRPGRQELRLAGRVVRPRVRAERRQSSASTRGKKGSRSRRCSGFPRSVRRD